MHARWRAKVTCMIRNAYQYAPHIADTEDAYALKELLWSKLSQMEVSPVTFSHLRLRPISMLRVVHVVYAGNSSEVRAERKPELKITAEGLILSSSRILFSRGKTVYAGPLTMASLTDSTPAPYTSDTLLA